MPPADSTDKLSEIYNGEAERAADEVLRATNVTPRLVLPPTYQPFPVTELPEPLRSFVTQGAAAIGPSCDPAYVALPVIAVVGSLIGATRVIELKRTWKEPSVFWSVNVGDSGSLKSPAADLAIGPLIEQECRLREEHERLRGEWRKNKEDHLKRKSDWENKRLGADPGAAPPEPVQRHLICEDITVEKVAEFLEDSPQGVLVSHDELDCWFQSFKRYKSGGGSDRGAWLKMHGARPLIYDRKTGDKRSIFVPRAAVSVTGSIQLGILAQALDGGAWEAGLAARLLLSCPPQLKKQWTDVELHPETAAAYARLLNELMDLPFTRDGKGRERPYPLTLDKKAKALWVEYYNEWADEQHAAEGQVRAAFGKLEAYAARFALLDHVVRHKAAGEDDRSPVSADSVYVGIALCRWFAGETRRVYQMLTENVDDSRARKLVEYIRSQGGAVTARDLQRSNQCKYKTAEDAQQALDDLKEKGAGNWSDRPTGAAGGRPGRVFTLSDPSPR